MKRLFIFLLFSSFIFSEKIEIEKIFKGEYLKPLPYNFKYKKEENSIYYLRKDEKTILEKFNLKEKKEEKIPLNFEPLSFEIYKDNFYILNDSCWVKTRDFKDFEEIIKETEGSFSENFNYYAYSKNFNLYIYDLNQKKEIKISDDGKENNFYGTIDWVYGEELDLREGFKFSKDDKFISFLQFNEENVGKFPLINFKGKYPSVDFQSYPKAGTKNPSVSLWLYDIEKNKKEIIYSVNSENLISFYGFTPDSKKLIFSIMPREQKEIIFYLYDIKEKEIKKIFKEESKFWINLIQEPLFLNEKDFLWLSELENLSLPFVYSIDGKLIKKIKRNFIVEKIIDIDENFLYFVSISPDPLKREFIKYSLKDGVEEKIFKKDGFLRVQKIENSEFFLVNYSKVKTPHNYYLLNKKSGEIIEIFNSKKEEFERIELPEVEFLKIEDLYGVILKPKDFNPLKKYPLIVYVYGGPHAQVVSDAFGGTYFLFHSFLVQEGFLVFSIDNRGSYGRGKGFESAIYKEFGRNELEDQLKGIKYLKNLKFIDEERIGIWGWSYGGFMVLYALTHTDIFKTGFAVAPVTDWNFYDTIYTERYLGLPEENREGYFNSSPINFVKNLKGKLYIVHGTGDDNVHFQNSVKFINELIKENISFDLMVYPERNHSIRDEKARVHLFEEILKFFKENL